MKLYSWNVNGIRAVINKGLFLPFIDSEQPDILCLQETKANKNQVEIDLPNYEEYWNSADKKGYSGTAIFSKIKPISIINNFTNEIIRKYDLDKDDYGDPTTEGRIISAEFEKFWVINVYTPNSKEDLSRLQFRYSQWDPAFLEHIKELENTKPILVCGDLNVAHTELDLANPKANIGKHGFTDQERAGFQNLIDNNLIDTFRKFNKNGGNYTWWSHWSNARTRNIGWRIDYWIASQSLEKMIIDTQIHPDILGSDHCPISIEIKE